MKRSQLTKQARAAMERFDAIRRKGAKPRDCGSCTLCCTFAEFKSATFEKPAFAQCEHCAVGSGCRIYANRPEPCRAFQCVWASGHLPEPARPDKIRAVVTAARAEVPWTSEKHGARPAGTPVIKIMTDNVTRANKSADLQAFVEMARRQGTPVIVVRPGEPTIEL